MEDVGKGFSFKNSAKVQEKKDLEAGEGGSERIDCWTRARATPSRFTANAPSSGSPFSLSPFVYRYTHLIPSLHYTTITTITRNDQPASRQSSSCGSPTTRYLIFLFFSFYYYFFFLPNVNHQRLLSLLRPRSYNQRQSKLEELKKKNFMGRRKMHVRAIEKRACE